MGASSKRRDGMRTAVLSVLLFCLPGVWLLAQGDLAAARGSVRGEAGVQLSDASVVARNLETGQAHRATSDARGRFELSGLPPGPYEFQVSRTGFLLQRRAEVVLGAGQLLSLDFVLQTDPESSPTAAGNRINESQLVGLPMNGRSYTRLATLQAGVADTGGEQASRGVGGGSLTMAGGRPVSNNFLLDGTNIMDTGNSVPRSAAGVQLGSDAVYQVQVLSPQSGAEYGRGSGGVLNSITRSGTEEFHGTLFEYFRNSKLDARNFIDQGPEPPPFKRNQFGFTLTGPIRNEKTYFMLGFEGMRDRLTITDLSFFPDTQAREGIITNAAGEELYRVPVHPRVRPYLALYPVPNAGSVGGGFGANFAPQFLPTDENYWTVRLDHKITDRDSIFVRYTFDDANSVSGQGVYLWRSQNQSRQQYLTLVGTHIFSLAVVNSFRLGYTRPVEAVENLSSIDIPPSLFFVRGAHQFGQIDLPGAALFGPTSMHPEGNIMNTFQFADDLVVQRGAHALKLGFEAHRYRWDVFNNFNKAAVWSFNSLESFLQAGPEGTTLNVALPGSDNRKGFRQSLVGLYLQDNYRASPRLQWNMGLRYELATIIQEKDGKLVYLPDPVHDTQAQIGPMLRENPSLWNFSPRLGFSWSLGKNQNTVLSGGFGLYYDSLLEYVVDLQKNSAPFYKRVIRINFDASDTFPDAEAAAAGLVSGTPFQVEVLDYNHMSSPTVLRYNWGIQQYLPGGWRVQASYVGARGNHLYRGYEANLYPVPITLPDGSLCFPPNAATVQVVNPSCPPVPSERAGPINPHFGAIGVTSSDAQSFYNTLQLSANKTLSWGFSMQASYSFAKSVDDISNFSSGTNAAYTRQYPHRRTLDRGLSDFDIRHRLAINYFYTLPLGPGQRWGRSGWLAHLLGSWRLGGIFSVRTGTPFHPRLSVRRRGYLFEANRPYLLPGRSNNPTQGVSTGCLGMPAGEKVGTANRYFDPCAFDIPEPGTLGNVGRNTIVGPGSFSMDLSLQKEFLLGGERRLQFRAEFFNLSNHTNFRGPVGASAIVFSNASGRVGPSAGRSVGSITTARQIQFALRLSF